MPSYAKFLKDILSNKKKLEEFETKALLKEIATKVKIPKKCFSIPCMVGNELF